MLLPFREKILYGMINENGDVIIQPTYETLSHIIEGYALGSKNEKWFYIDEKGEVVKVFNVDEMTPFHEGMAALNLYGCIGYINNRFEVEIEPEYGRCSSDFNEGLASVCTPKKYGQKLYGYIDKKGERVIELKFDCASKFKEGLAIVNVDDKVRAIDKTGKTIFEAKYDWLNDFNEGRAFFRKEELWGIVDTKGNEIIEPILEEDEECYEYYEEQEFHEGHALIYRNKKYGYIDINGNTVTDVIYQDATGFTEGLASVKFNNRWFVINRYFKTIGELNCDSIGNFKSGMACISINGKWGYINKKGEMVIEPKYDYVSNFYNDIATVILHGKYGYIHKSGNEIFVANEICEGSYYSFLR